MANTFEKQTLVDGERNLVVRVHLEGDGTGDLSEMLFVDLGDYSSGTEVKVMSIDASFSGFTAELIWEGSPNRHFFNIPDFDVHQNFEKFGGIINDSTDKTGNILINTTGLGNGDTGHLILTMRKRG